MEVNNNSIRNTLNIKKSISIPESYLHRFLTCLLACACYLNSLDGDFVHDDIFAIRNNGDVTGSEPLLAILYNDFWGKPISDITSHKSYRPLCTFTFRLNYWLGNGSPYSFHVVNVCLHAVMTFLFTYTCETVVFLSPSCALIAGSLFAVHPIHTEAVAGIVGRADILAGIFFLLSLISYVRSIDNNWLWYSICPRTVSLPLLCCSIICATIAMLCKEHGVTVLGLCLLYDVFVCCGRAVRCSFSKTRPLSSLIMRASVVICVVMVLLFSRVWIMGGQLPTFIHQDNPASFSESFLTRCLTYPYIWFMNVWLLLAPTTLCYDWQVGSIPLVESLLDVRNLATLGCMSSLVCLMYTCFLRFQKYEELPFLPLFCGLLLLILPFVPASNLFFRVGFVLAERLLYIPSCGICILLATGVSHIQTIISGSHRNSIAQRKFIVVCMISLLTLMSMKTWNQNRVWQNRETLFRSGVLSLPHNAKTHYNFANHLKDLGNFKEAELHYRKSIQLYPLYASAYNNLGTIVSNKSEAEHLFQEALRLIPDHKGALVNLGSALFKRGKRLEGIKALQKVVEKDPYYIDGLTMLASMMTEMKEWKSAESYFSIALEHDSSNSDLIYSYAVYLHMKGDIDGAVRHYMLSVRGSSTQKWIHLVDAAKALNQLGQVDEAEVLIKRALSKKRNADALDILGLIYYKQGRTMDTINTYREIKRFDPRNVNAAIHYSQVLAENGDQIEAEEILQNILILNPENLDILSQTANVMGQQGKHNEALGYLKTAIMLARQRNDNQHLQRLLFQQGNHFKDLKMYQEALKAYNEAVQRNPDHAKAHLNLGAIYHSQGIIARARYHYKKVLQLEPRNAIALENVRKLNNLEMSFNHGEQEQSTKT